MQHFYVYIFERSMIWRYSSSFIARSSAIPTKASNIRSTYLPFSRILNRFLFVFFYVTFYRYVLKAGTAWTLKLCYTRFFSLWKLQVLFLIRSETWEIMLEFTSPPSQKILFYSKFKYQKHKLNISSVFTLLCFFELRMKRSSKCCAACRTWHTKTWHTNTWSN